jgi:hypothetical protein
MWNVIIYLMTLFRYLIVLYVCLVDRCLSFCPFSFGHCVVWPSSIYGFWLTLWYLQTILIDILPVKYWSVRFDWPHFPPPINLEVMVNLNKVESEGSNGLTLWYLQTPLIDILPVKCLISLIKHLLCWKSL